MNFYSLEDFLNDTECKVLVELFHKYFDTLGKKYNDRNLINVITAMDNLSDDTAINDSDILKKITSKISNYIYQIDEHAFINYHQIVHWPEKSYQPRHIDFDYHTYTSIVYLNDDFSGGQTVVGINKITPKKGKIITFKGNILDHEVLPIREGNRYTLAVWYKTSV